MISNYQDLINKINDLENDDQKIKYLMSYFLENIKYDYVFLERCAKKKTLEQIDEMYNNVDEIEREQVLIDIEEKFGISKELVDRIAENYGKKHIVPAEPERVAFGKKIPAVPEHEISYSLMDAVNMIKSQKISGNGLMEVGVCKDFGAYIKSICDDVKLKCDIVYGETSVSSDGSHIGHCWNIINGKHYDITYAMFVRDGYNDWDKKSTLSDWLGVSVYHLFFKQPTRKITKINDTYLDKVVDINSVSEVGGESGV